MRKLWIFFMLVTALSLTGCAGGGLFCDPRYQHCGGANPKMQDEIADLVISNRRQQGRSQAQAPCADTDVRWATANIGRKTGDLLKRRSNIIGIEID